MRPKAEGWYEADLPWQRVMYQVQDICVPDCSTRDYINYRILNERLSIRLERVDSDYNFETNLT